MLAVRRQDDNRSEKAAALPKNTRLFHYIAGVMTGVDSVGRATLSVTGGATACKEGRGGGAVG